MGSKPMMYGENAHPSYTWMLKTNNGANMYIRDRAGCQAKVDARAARLRIAHAIAKALKIKQDKEREARGKFLAAKRLADKRRREAREKAAAAAKALAIKLAREKVAREKAAAAAKALAIKLAREKAA